MPQASPLDEFTDHLRAVRTLWDDHLRLQISRATNRLGNDHSKMIKWFVRKGKKMQELSSKDWERYAEEFRSKKFGYEVYPNELKRGIRAGVAEVADDLGVSNEMAEKLLSLHINDHGKFLRLVR